jgi:rare lipoprotein A
MHVAIACFLLVMLHGVGCATSSSGRADGGWAGASQQGLASYYADKYHGRKTANSETFDVNAMTAAHRTLPFNTRVRVTNLKNDRSVVVRINDRGPFIEGRVIDLAPAAARKIDMIRDGVVPVKLEILGSASAARSD